MQRSAWGRRGDEYNYKKERKRVLIGNIENLLSEESVLRGKNS